MRKESVSLVQRDVCLGSMYTLRGSMPKLFAWEGSVHVPWTWEQNRVLFFFWLSPQFRELLHYGLKLCLRGVSELKQACFFSFTESSVRHLLADRTKTSSSPELYSLQQLALSYSCVHQTHWNPIRLPFLASPSLSSKNEAERSKLSPGNDLVSLIQSDHSW